MSGRAIAALVASIQVLILGACTALEAPWADPPDDMREGDLAGTWQARTAFGTETVLLNADGTYQQTFVQEGDEVRFESPQGQWFLERLTNGRVRLHLIGARYYKDGLGTAQREGRIESCPWESDLPQACLQPFYDPFAGEYVEMPGKLILNIRVDSQGRFILYQMWTSGDGGFPIFGGEDNYYTAVATP